VLLAYHIAVMAAIAIYATGQSQASKPAQHSSGQPMAEAGILLLLILSLIMDAAFVTLIIKGGTQPLKALLLAIVISLLLLKVRLIYQTIAVFLNYEQKFNPVTGSIALRAIFQFLPGAFILLALVTGGVVSARKQEEMYEAVQADIPLSSLSSGKEHV
jgi:presenilin-like A22 family membrane protease